MSEPTPDYEPESDWPGIEPGVKERAMVEDIDEAFQGKELSPAATYRRAEELQVLVEARRREPVPEENRLPDGFPVEPPTAEPSEDTPSKRNVGYQRFRAAFQRKLKDGGEIGFVAGHQKIAHLMIEADPWESIQLSWAARPQTSRAEYPGRVIFPEGVLCGSSERIWYVFKQKGEVRKHVYDTALPSSYTPYLEKFPEDMAGQAQNILHESENQIANERFETEMGVGFMPISGPEAEWLARVIKSGRPLY